MRRLVGEGQAAVRAMKNDMPPKTSKCIGLGLIAATLLASVIPLGLLAQQASGTPISTVLSTKKVAVGSHTVTFNRIATPALPPKTPSLNSVVSSQPVSSISQKAMVLSLSVTVYNQQLSEIHWQSNGQEYVFWSNLNFDYLRNYSELEINGTTYSLVFSMEDQTVQNLDAWNAQAEQAGLPTGFALVQSNATSSTQSSQNVSYVMSSPQTGADAAVTQAMADLHSYFNSNRASLIQAYQNNLAAQAAQQQSLKSQPAAPANIVINFFPIHSTHVSPNSAQVGSK